MKLVKLVTSLFLVLMAIACNEDPITETEATLFDIQGENGFVGTLDGTDAFIALLVAEKEAIVYVCNGEEEIYEWFRGNITNPGNISFKNSYGSQVDGKFAGQSFIGSVKLTDGSTHSFTAIPNTGKETGIFQVYGELAKQEGIVAGWILNEKSEERGSFRFNSVFMATPTKPKITTITFKSRSFSIQRYSAIYHPDSLTVLQVNR